MFPSLLPLADSSLKRVAKKHGGWVRILEPDFKPSSELLNDLQSAGYGLDKFTTSRRFFAAHPERLSFLRIHLAGSKHY